MRTMYRDGIRGLARTARDGAGAVNEGAYAFRGALPDDHRERRVHFATLLDGQRRFAYATGLARSDAASEEQGLHVEPYLDVRDAASRGASFRVLVPDHREGMRRRRVTLEHVPYALNDRTTDVARSLSWDVSPWPSDSDYLRIGRDYLLATPETVAAYLAAARWAYDNGGRTTVPADASPFPIVSPLAVLVDNLLQNNVLVKDPTLATKHQLRQPHRAERSRMLGIAFGVYGDRMLWSRGDPKVQDYAWALPGPPA